MKFFKSNIKNKLSASQMTRLMTVQFHGAPICDFNPDVAIHHWNQSSQRARRPNFANKTLQHVEGNHELGEQELLGHEFGEQQGEAGVATVEAAEPRNCWPLTSPQYELDFSIDDLSNRELI